MSMITRVLTLGPPRIRRAPVIENLILPTIRIDCLFIDARITRVSILGSGGIPGSRARPGYPPPLLLLPGLDKTLRS